MTTTEVKGEKKGTYVRITFQKTADGKLIVAKTEIVKPAQSAARSMRYSG